MKDPPVVLWRDVSMPLSLDAESQDTVLFPSGPLVTPCGADPEPTRNLAANRRRASRSAGFRSGSQRGDLEAKDILQRQARSVVPAHPVDAGAGRGGG